MNPKFYSPAPHVGSTEADTAARLAITHVQGAKATGGIPLVRARTPGPRWLRRGWGWLQELEAAASALRIMLEEKGQ
jgi:hypothetical protein